MQIKHNFILLQTILTKPFIRKNSNMPGVELTSQLEQLDDGIKSIIVIQLLFIHNTRIT